MWLRFWHASVPSAHWKSNMMKRYEIAGLKIDLVASGRTEKQAEPYAVPVQGPADMAIQVDVDRILQCNPTMTDPDLAEYLGTGFYFASLLPRFQGLMLHSSAVICQGRAYLFTAPSGMGKSTHTQKWVRLFHAEYLNDDKPALRLVEGRWMAYGTPWSGKHDLSMPRGVLLGGIAAVERGEENRICPMSAAEALPYLMSQTAFKLPRKRMDMMLTVMDDLLRQIPVWKLTCRNDDDAAILSHSVMVR